MPKYIFGSGYLIIWLLVSRYWVLPLGFLWPSLVRAETSLRLRQLDQFPAHTSPHALHKWRSTAAQWTCSSLCCTVFLWTGVLLLLVQLALLLTLSVQRVSNVAFSSTCIVVVYCSWVCMRWCRLHWCSALLYWYWVPGFELLYALVQCTIMLTPRVLHFAARLSVIYAFGRAALFVCPTCGDDHAFWTDRLKVLLKGI